MNEENLINRIRFVLIDHPNSTSAKIGAMINVSRQKVSQAIASDTSGLISNSLLSREGPMRYILTGMKAKAAEAPRNLMSDAIAGLIDPLTTQLRQKLDALLETILKEEVSSAIESIQSKVELRLSDALRAPVPVIDPIEKYGLFKTSSQIEKERQNANMRDLLDAQILRPGPIIYVPPAGDYAPKDVVSKRTSHKKVDKAAAIKAPAVQDSETVRPSKLTIVGIRTNVQTAIKRDFGKLFDLRLYSPDQLSTIRQAVRPGDEVICLADYISHKHTDVVDSAGAKVTIIHGGMHILRGELDTRLSEKAS